MLKADTVIYACKMKAKSAEAQSFYGICPQTAMIGDCKKARKVLEANAEGYFFALNI